MGTTTTNYALYKPDDGESGWATTFNANFDTIDTELLARAPKASPALTGTPTAPTAAPGTSTTQVATTAFVQAAANAGGTTAQRPGTPVLYQNYFDTTLGKPIWYNGSVWKDATGATV
jgi:hypothetical protein